MGRKVNKNENFKPSSKSAVIIYALSAVMAKSQVYNQLIETYGKQFAAERLSNEDFLKLLTDIDNHQLNANKTK